MLEPLRATLLEQRGLLGDRSAKKTGRARQVTLFQAEHLSTVSSFLGQQSIEPSLLRRNLMVSGINLLSLRQARFSVGDAVLEGTGHCHPCSRLEETLGHGGYNACRGLAGITARVLEGSIIEIGASVLLLDASPPTPKLP